MDVRCPRCNTEYELDDALVSGRGTSVKCTHCGFLFRLPAAPGSMADVWIIRSAGGQLREFASLATLQRAISDRQVHIEDEMSRGGDTPFRPLREIFELQSFFQDAGRRSVTLPPPVGAGPLVLGPLGPPAPSSTGPLPAALAVKPQSGAVPLSSAELEEVGRSGFAGPLPPAASSTTPLPGGADLEDGTHSVSKLPPPVAVGAASTEALLRPIPAAPTLTREAVAAPPTRPAALIATLALSGEAPAPMPTSATPTRPSAWEAEPGAVESPGLPVADEPTPRFTPAFGQAVAQGRAAWERAHESVAPPAPQRKARWAAAVPWAILGLAVLGAGLYWADIVPLPSANSARVTPLVQVGRQRLREADLEAATVALAQASALGEEHPEVRAAWLQLEMAQAEIAFLREQILSAQRLLGISPSSPVEAVRAALVLRVQRAEAALKRVPATVARPDELWRARVDLMRLNGDIEGAQLQARAVVDEYSHAALEYVSGGGGPKAAATRLAALPGADQRPEGWALRVLAEVAAGQGTQARATLQQLERLMPLYPLLAELRVLLGASALPSQQGPAEAKPGPDAGAPDAGAEVGLAGELALPAPNAVVAAAQVASPAPPTAAAASTPTAAAGNATPAAKLPPAPQVQQMQQMQQGSRPVAPAPSPAAPSPPQSTNTGAVGRPASAPPVSTPQAAGQVNPAGSQGGGSAKPPPTPVPPAPAPPAGAFAAELARADALHRTGDLEGADRAYRKLLTQQPSSVPVLMSLGALARQRRDPGAAQGYYGRVLELEPTNMESLAALADMQWFGGDKAGAVTRYRRVLARVGTSTPLGQQALARIQAYEAERTADAPAPRTSAPVSGGRE